jgi:hypothetical protein
VHRLTAMYSSPGRADEETRFSLPRPLPQLHLPLAVCVPWNAPIMIYLANQHPHRRLQAGGRPKLPSVCASSVRAWCNPRRKRKQRRRNSTTPQSDRLTALQQTQTGGEPDSYDAKRPDDELDSLPTHLGQTPGKSAYPTKF